ncbi:recombination protein NinG [Brenneria goodwinii]|uniref:Protein NinG n=1 Tax=Brenneria goodwinii TaxID=1109412 RepID=A0A0G4K131_9GAMM|nr:recombination protein NinG [Brenneria goodwinii]MCG8155177.1 recombination protein NinG [Brenneria goodwinii]MCG8159421.1 recombination protein NinG [Brenneria goodwinii]MCG8164410.1 recombination protein NinG [Brenneria goodwinii]MCG8169024.1 recombination protein NinG [Brenneria goodwinii]MCG8173280.1 recombination protein NinG [Brenneria goodwinii]
MAKLPRWKCKSCGQCFHPSRDGQIVCFYDYSATAAYGKKQTERARQRAKQENKQIHREKARAERQQIRIRKLVLKTRSDWKREAQAAFNRYVCLHDAGKSCISCGAMPKLKFGGTMDCGHYHSRGVRPWLAFNLHNTAGQCVRSNRDRGGAQKAFEQGLINRIGPDRVEDLNCNNTPRKFDVEYFKRIKSIFTRKVRTHERRRACHQEAA